MRRRFENINTVAGGKIPVFACSISALQPHGEILYLFLVVDTDLMEQLWRLPMF